MIYEYRCECGAEFERVLPVSRYREPQQCECGKIAKKLISRSSLLVREDICYDSPIDGRPITSMKARLEDLARNDCVPYDPDIKQDYQKRIKEGEEKLEKSFDTLIEKEIDALPSRKKEKLFNELKHADVDYHRATAPAKPIATTITR